MIHQTTVSWPDYELIDTGNGQRLERFGQFLVVRPDPNVLWEASESKHPGWVNPDLRYVGEQQDTKWEVKNPGLLNGWVIRYQDLSFKIKPTPFRHMGLFPEQASQWRWLTNQIKESKKRVSVLNLFAYTGAASLVAAKAGASVCQVDASQGTTNWAKENAALSGLPDTAIRWIVDDVLKFMKREIRRGNSYDLILMDPPVFGRGPKGEIWRLEERAEELISCAKQLLSQQPVGIMMNFYATSLYPTSLLRIFKDLLGEQFSHLELGLLSLAEENSKKELPTGYFIRS